MLENPPPLVMTPPIDEEQEVSLTLVETAGILMPEYSWLSNKGRYLLLSWVAPTTVM